MTRRRKLLILLAAVPVLFVTVALLYLNFADLSGWRDTAARLASDAIGRELRINGEFQPEVGFTTRVVATDITLANAEWSDDPLMVSVDRLAGEIDLLSILFGPITIHNVEVTGGRVIFQTGADGRFNWVFETDGSAEGDGGDVELVISHAVVNDLQLVYTPPGDRSLQAALAHLEITDDGTGMLDLDLEGSLEGTPLEISGRLGTFIGLINAAAVEHDLEGHLGDIGFSTSGHIAELSTLGGVDFTARVQGADLLAVAEFLDLPGLPGGAFQVDLGVKPATAGSNLEFSASVGTMTAEIAGTIDSLTEPGVVDVKVEASGPDVAAVGALTGVEGLPTDPFAVSGHVRWEGFPITCDNIEVRVGDNTLSANGVLGDPPLMLGTDFTFEGDGPNIASIAALAGVSLPKDSFSVSGRLVRQDGGINVEGVEARVGRTTLEVNGTIGDPPEYAGTALTVRGNGPNLAHFQDLAGVALPAESFEITGKLSQGEGAIKLESVRARLGRATLRVDGVLKTEKDLSGTTLRIEAKGPDATQLRILTGLRDLPEEAWTLAGGLAVLDSGYGLDGVSATVGSLEARADGRVAAAHRLVGTDLRLHVEDPDLSHAMPIFGVNGFPQVTIRADGRLRVEDAGYRLDGVTATAGDIDVAVEGIIGATSDLDGTTGHVSVHGPRLSSLGMYFNQSGFPAAPFSVVGNLHIDKGAYALGKVVVLVDHNRATLDGTLLPVKGLVGTDVQIEVTAPDLGRAGRLVAGLTELPELPAEPFTLTTHFLIDDAGYEIDGLHATLDQAVVAVDGRVGAVSGLVGTDLTVKVDGPNASLLPAFSGVKFPVAPFKVRGRVQRTDSAFLFDRVAVQLGGHSITLHGSLGEAPRLVGTDLELYASGESTALIAELTGFRKLPDHSFRISGRFHGTPEEFTTDGLEIVLGESDLTGSLEVDIRAKPAVTARLSSKHLDLAPFMQASPEGGDDSTDTAVAAGTPKKKTVISNNPIDFAPLHRADADVMVAIGTLQLPLKRFREVELGARLENGRLEVHRFSLIGQREGRGSGTLVLEPVGDSYRLRTVLDFDALRLDLPGKDSADASSEPPIDLDVRLDVVGKSPHGFAGSANGSVQVVIGKGVMDNQVLDLVTADLLLTLLNAFNPFAKHDVATELQCGVFFVSLEDGVARLDPMALQSDKMTMLGKGKIDLGTEKLDLEWITKPRKGIGISASMITNPYIKLGGTLSEPAVHLKGMEAVASTGVAVATLGLSLVAKGMFDRVTAEKKVCKKALEEIGRQPDNTSKKSKKKQR